VFCFCLKGSYTVIWTNYAPDKSTNTLTTLSKNEILNIHMSVSNPLALKPKPYIVVLNT